MSSTQWLTMCDAQQASSFALRYEEPISLRERASHHAMPRSSSEPDLQARRVSALRTASGENRRTRPACTNGIRPASASVRSHAFERRSSVASASIRRRSLLVMRTGLAAMRLHARGHRQVRVHCWFEPALRVHCGFIKQRQDSAIARRSRNRGVVEVLTASMSATTSRSRNRNWAPPPPGFDRGIPATRRMRLKVSSDISASVQSSLAVHPCGLRTGPVLLVPVGTASNRGGLAASSRSWRARVAHRRIFAKPSVPVRAGSGRGGRPFS